MKRLYVLLAVLASGYAGDWLGYGGDPQRSNWQRHGKALTAASVRNLKLLWKRQLGDQPGWLSSPVIIGPTITHRGVRELVFVADGHDNLYAVDADLGTLFWKRHFDVQSKPACASGMAATPVIEPDPDEDMSGDPVTDDEDDDDEAGPMRPLYGVDSDGGLHTIRVSDGTDINAPITFLPPKAKYSNLNFWSGAVYAGTYGGCNGVPDGLWSLDVKRPGAKPEFHSSKGGRGIVIGPTGAVYCDVADGLATTELHYKGRELLVTEAHDGRLLLLDAGKLSVVAEYHKPRDEFKGVANWQDSGGVRWIYASGERNVRAFKLTGPSRGPKLELAWTFDSTARAGPPVVTNGVVLLLSGDFVAGPGYSTLKALDAATGKELYSSENTIGFPTNVPDLAVANGHICFGDARSTLYCFGIPLER
jgi:outer membrane protein assembly factor BamB